MIQCCICTVVGTINSKAVDMCSENLCFMVRDIVSNASLSIPRQTIDQRYFDLILFVDFDLKSHLELDLNLDRSCTLI